MSAEMMVALAALAIGVMGALADVFQGLMMNEQRRYQNWLREDFARSNGLKQYCFTTRFGRDKWVHVRYGSDKTNG